MRTAATETRKRAPGKITSIQVCAAAVIIGMAVVPSARADVIDAIWIGGYAHDVSDLGHGKESNSQDVQLEVDTGQPQILRLIGAPHLNAVVAINSARETDFAAAGLAWDRHLVGPFSASLQFGFGYTDGVDQPPRGPAGDYDRSHRLLLGSKTLFREAAGLDWRVSNHWSVGLQFVHASNGMILGSSHFNEGINDLGMRLGYRFN